MNTSTPIVAIDSSANNEWAVEVDTGDGLETIEGVISARLLNTKRDMDFVLGQSPDGNFASVRRRGGGGAIDILHTIDPMGNLWVGGVMQRRHNIADEPIFNLMRGYKDPGEDMLSAAAREAVEESGREDLFHLFPLEGEVVNIDSAMNDSIHGGGVQFFRMEVPFGALTQREGDTVGFNQTALTEDQRKEGIYKVIFIRGDLSTISRLADGFTLIGFLKLLSYLEESDSN